MCFPSVEFLLLILKILQESTFYLYMSCSILLISLQIEDELNVSSIIAFCRNLHFSFDSSPFLSSLEATYLAYFVLKKLINDGN